MKPISAIQKGKQAEDIALAFFLTRKWTLVVRNYRCRFGEIDLIMQQEDWLIFVEVRSRQENTMYASAQESVDKKKQAKIIKSAACFLAQYQNAQYTQLNCRFDVIALSDSKIAGISVNWLQSAFELDD